MCIRDSRKWKYDCFEHAQWKICNITLIYGRIAKIFASFRKSGLMNTMVMSDFSPEVEIRPFRTCAMKNMQYSYLWLNCRNFRALQEIRVEEQDGDVRFFTGSGYTAVSRMCNASGHNYWNSAFIMDVAMGQIPRSTERISSCSIRSVEYLFTLSMKSYCDTTRCDVA